jgi:hypothetical protein
MKSLDHPLLPQAAALLYSIVTHLLPASATLEQVETVLHRLSQEAARCAAEQYARARAAAAEEAPPTCACGRRMAAEQQRRRAVLLLFGLIQFRMRRYRCPACGAWQCPTAERLELAAKQRMTRTMQEIITHFGLSWGYQVAAVLLERVLPVAGVSAKTVERTTKRTARKRQEQEDAEAAACQELPEELGEPKRVPERIQKALPAFLRPERIFIGLDGILVRGRTARNWLEIQVGSMWSAWKDLPDRKHPRREILDRTLMARAGGWEKLGEQVWRMFVGRGGLRKPRPEVVVLGDGASGIRSLWELQFPWCRALLDRWHLWEKVKERAREVIGHRERALNAAQGVYERLKRGAVDQAQALIQLWPATNEWARKRRERLLAYLERNRDIIGDYEALVASGYMTGSGLTEKANDLVVAPRMKNGKMHWSRDGANAVALLRAHVLNDPHAPILPT